MSEQITIRKMVTIGRMSLVPLLVVACSQPVMQSAQQDSAVTPLIGAKKLAPPPPAAPAAPGPAPAQRPTPPASYFEPVGPFFFYVETLTANVNPNKYGFAPTIPCVLSGVFKRGMKMVVRFDVLDTKTGKRITDRDGAVVKLVLPHGEEVAGRWNVRGNVAALPDSAWMWDTSWDIPPDYPVGSLNYRIVVTTKDGRTGTFNPPVMKTTAGGSEVRIID
jgi:hypothetical protein